MPLAFAVVKDAVENRRRADAAPAGKGSHGRRSIRQLGAIARPGARAFRDAAAEDALRQAAAPSLQALAEGRDPGDLTTIEDPARWSRFATHSRADEARCARVYDARALFQESSDTERHAMTKKRDLGAALMCIALLVGGCGSPSAPPDRPAAAAPAVQPESAPPQARPDPASAESPAAAPQEQVSSNATPVQLVPVPAQPDSTPSAASSATSSLPPPVVKVAAPSPAAAATPSPVPVAARRRRLLPLPLRLRCPPRPLCQRRRQPQRQPWWTRGVPSRWPRRNPD